MKFIESKLLSVKSSLQAESISKYNTNAINLGLELSLRPV